jgi:nucleotide-binding universal stress UspA family protein
MATLARILCAIDLEKASERAFDRALNLAIISEAKLHLLHATPANVPYSWRAAERLRYLTGFRERAESAGVKVRVEEQHGDPARVIVLHANARKVDLVVLGSNREGAGAGSERGRPPNGFFGVQHGPCSSFHGTLVERVCSTRKLHGHLPGVRSSRSRCPTKQEPEKHGRSRVTAAIAHWHIMCSRRRLQESGPSGTAHEARGSPTSPTMTSVSCVTT